MAKYLSLDMGAESGRLVAVDIGQEISTTEIFRFPTPVTTDHLGRRCWDFKKIMDSILQGLKVAATQGPFVSIGVDTWGLDFGLLNQEMKLIGNPVSHRDHRTDGYLKITADRVGLERLHNETGSQLLEINSIYQLVAMQDKTPDELKEAHLLLMMPDLVLYELTGQTGTEYTIASTTGIFDVFRNDWNFNLASDLGIPTNIFGKVEPAGTTRGKIKDSIVKSTGITPLTLLGVELNKFMANEITLSHRLTNEGGYEGTNRLLRNVMGLWLIQEVRRDLEAQGTKLTYAELVELAQAESNPWRTLIYVDAPIFVHAGEMIARIKKFAAQTNQPIPETPGELAQTVFASLALQYGLTSDILENLSGTPMKQINIVGGGSQNLHLSQLTADISKREVVTGPIEATAMGNAIVQAISNGELKDLKSARELVKSSNLNLKTFKPREVKDLKELRERYQELTKVEMR